LGSGTDDRGIAVAPIKPVPSIGAYLTALDYQEVTIAVMFDFVNPLLALWRLIHWGSKLGLNEAEPRGY
jgi:hypothetical protein